MNTTYINGKYKTINIIFENEKKKVILIQDKNLKNFIMKTYNIYEDYSKEKNKLSLIQSDFALKLIENFEEDNKYYIIEEYYETNLEELLTINNINQFDIEFIKQIFKQFNKLFYQMIKNKIYFEDNLELKKIFIKNKLINKKGFYHIKIKNFTINSNKDIEKNNLFKIGSILFELFFKEKYIIENKIKINDIDNNEVFKNLLYLLLNNKIEIKEYFQHFFFVNEKNMNDPKNLIDYSLILKNIDIYTIL
jgi:hypothetical protein